MMSFSPAAARAVLLAVLGIAVAACAPQAPVRPAPAQSSAPPDPAARARAALDGGDYRAAADAYAALVLAPDADTATRPRHAALAALAYQDSGDSGQADLILSLFQEELDADPGLVTARACALLAAGLAEEALALARTVDAGALTGYARGALARCRGEAAWRSGQPAEAAQALVDAHRFQVPPAAAAALAATTWRALANQPTPELEAALAAAESAPVSGWYALALEVRRAGFDSAAIEQALGAWRVRYPAHPAGAVLDIVREDVARFGRPPARIALLLPFDAALGAAANAVRDGFVLGWYGAAAPRPRIDIYSTSAGPLDELVRRAVAAGAEFIVGPLQKDRVEALVREVSLPVPTLALNVMDAQSAAPPQLFQFGLTPEDEALEVARRASAQGSRALALAPDTAWGRRVGAAYTAAWSEVGGELLSTVYYNERLESYADAIERALNIDLSNNRIAALRRHLGIPIHGAARRRADIDLILLAAFPSEARQVIPQLRYFGAGDIPVFATSHVYAGSVSAERDRDLDGIVFGDMPWVLGTGERQLRALVEATWGGDASAYARLYAFGMDAYRVLPYLMRMRAQPGLRVPGASGTLAMDARGVLHRQLTWMRFVDGVPRALDATSLPHGPP